MRSFTLWETPLKHLVPKSLIAMACACALGSSALAQSAPLASGIDKPFVDPAVRVQDDLFRHVNGNWLKTTPIPPDRASTGAFEQIHESIQTQLRELVEAAGKNGEDLNARKIGDLYAGFMDEASIEKLGIAPLGGELAKVDAVNSPSDLAALSARMVQLGAAAPLNIDIHQDAKDSTRYVADFAQSGLGMPDRDYFLKDDDARLKSIRVKYEQYLARMLTLAGEKDADAQARAVVALETELARAQWTKVQNRDPVKTYNKLSYGKLKDLAPGQDWDAYFDAAGLKGRVDDVIVSQPSYVSGFAKLVQSTPLSTWKAYYKTRLLSAYAPFLSKDFVDARFAFAGTTLRGTPENLPRWKRGVNLVEQSMGQALGKLYTEKYFPAQSKARMEELVANLLRAYRQSIDTLDWMSPQTRKQAQAKLAKFTPKIGYPRQWRDYSALDIRAGDLVGNVMRARANDYAFHVGKLGKPVDRDEWFMTPQTVNAYYNPELNEIVFPAAILQPPFFDPKADDAVNYGGIGAVIGHEISHGFDDQGSQYDGDGNLRNWWTPQDRKRFEAKARVLVQQYGAFSPLPGYHVNGELTLGENMADNSGLAIAYKAYHLSLGAKKAPVIDGLTGDQRFFFGFAQVWRGKVRDEALIERIKADPHAPDEIRANGTVRNHPGFYSTFGVKPGDAMYLPPAKRVTIW
jgi:predicted metalloendopeptidase